jgi:hypothetical protein
VEALDEVSKVLLYPKLESGEGGAFLRYGLRVGFTSSEGALRSRKARESRMGDPSTFLLRPTLRSDAFAQSRREEGGEEGNVEGDSDSDRFLLASAGAPVVAPGVR